MYTFVPGPLCSMFCMQASFLSVYATIVLYMAVLYSIPFFFKSSMKFIYFLKLKKIFIGVELIYNVVLVSGVQQSESVIHRHTSTLF